MFDERNRRNPLFEPQQIVLNSSEKRKDAKKGFWSEGYFTMLFGQKTKIRPWRIAKIQGLDWHQDRPTVKLGQATVVRKCEKAIFVAYDDKSRAEFILKHRSIDKLKKGAINFTG